MFKYFLVTKYLLKKIIFLVSVEDIESNLDSLKVGTSDLKECNDSLESSVDKLNKNCLFYIFELLSVSDRIKIERTCKKWKEVSHQSWSKFKELHVKPEFLGLRPNREFHQYPEISVNEVEEILKRCGKYLKKIDSSYEEIGCILSIVAKYCPDIKSIKCCEASEKGLKNLSRKCRNILEFIYENNFDKIFTTQISEEALEDLFLNNKKLQVFSISQGFPLENCLLKLPFAGINKMNLQIMLPSEIMNANVNKVIKNSKNLCSIRTHVFNESIILSLGASCNNLTKIKLTYFGSIDNVDAKLSQVFIKNRNIKSLKLDGFNSMTGECLLNLNKSTLEKLYLVAFHEVKKKKFDQ